jgi:hypothetical protein
VPGQADGDRPDHPVDGLRRGSDDDHDGIAGMGVRVLLGRRHERLSDWSLAPLEPPALLHAGELRADLGLQLPRQLVEALLDFHDGVRRHHLQGGQMGDVDDGDFPLAAAQQPGRGVERPDGGRGPVVADDQVQLLRSRRAGTHVNS